LFSSPFSRTIVALGDSTTAGHPAFCSPLENPPDGEGDERSQYLYWIGKRHPDWRLLNRGVGGERSDEVLRRFDRDVLGAQPDLVVVIAGVNDLFQGYAAEWVREHLRKIYEKGLQAHISVMAGTILPYNGISEETQNQMAEVNEWIRAYAKEREMGFCDTFKALNDPVRPGNLVNTADGIHPDVEGYRKMGEAILRCLEKQFPS